MARSCDPWGSNAFHLFEAAAKANFLPLHRTRANKERHRSLASSFITPSDFINLLYTSWFWINPIAYLWFLDAFNEVWKQDWFQRAWTFQEAILSSESILVTESETFSWAGFVQGITALRFVCGELHERGFDGYSVYHYDRLDKEYPGSLHISRSRLRDMPFAFHAMDRLVISWMMMPRPTLRRPGEDIEGTNLMHSAFEIQRAYSNRFRLPLTKTAYGLHLPVVYLLLVLVAHSPFIIVIVIYYPDGNGWTTYMVSWLTIVAFVCMPQLLLASRSMRFVDYLFEKSDVDSSKTVLLEGIIQTLRERNAKVSQDKSYALYGILKRLGLELPEPNYNKTPAQVYQELILALLEWSPAALVLLLDAGKNTGSEINSRIVPSWVPEWHQIPPKPTISASLFLRGPYRDMDATPASEPRFLLDSSRNKLTVLGRWKSNVHYCTRRFSRLAESLLQSENVKDLTPILTPLESLMSYLSAVRCLTRAIRPLQTNISGSMGPGEYGDQWYSSRYMSKVTDPYLQDALDLFFVITQSFVVEYNNPSLDKIGRLIKVLLREESRGPIRLSSVRAVDDVAYTLFSDKESLACFIELINDLAVNDRRLFITSDNFLGCGSKDVVQGDKILLAAGVPAPMILRPAGTALTNECIVVCSAFVLGWMDGKMFSTRDLESVTLV